MGGERQGGDVVASAAHNPHTPLPQQRALSTFRAGATQVLVATDVGGRGLHVPSLSYVVNYDFPSTLDAYIHRVGRTGRLGANGHAYSFFTRPLAPLARPLAELLVGTGAAVDPNLVRLAEAYEEGVRMGGEEEGGGDDDDDETPPCAATTAPKLGGSLPATELPGLYRKRGRAGGDSYDEDGVTAAPASSVGKSQKKSLPGLLRRKLAKEKKEGG